MITIPLLVAFAFIYDNLFETLLVGFFLDNQIQLFDFTLLLL